MLSIACAGCERPLLVHEEHRGKPLSCPDCGARFVVPEEAGPAVDGLAEDSRSSPELVPARRLLGAGGGRVLSRFLLGLALLPLGIPLLARAGPRASGELLWVVLGLGLAAGCLLLVCYRRWPPAVRGALALVLAGLGYALAFAVLLLGLLGDGLTGFSPPRRTLATGQGPRAAFLERGTLGADRPTLPPQLTDGRPGIWLTPPSAVLRPGNWAVQRNELSFVTRLGELLAVAVDPAVGAALVTTRQGTLKHYSYPEFTLRATYRLERPAYRIVLDGSSGRLYAAVSDPSALHVGLFGDRAVGRGDLLVYDVQPLLQGKGRMTEPLSPTHVLHLPGPLGSLLLSPDHQALFYLCALPAQVLVGRYDTASRSIEKQRKVPNGTGGLCLTPDGKMLVLTTVGSIVALDSVSLEIQSMAPAPRVPFDLAATNEGVVYFSERGVGAGVSVLDLRREPPYRGRWGTGLEGRTYLQLAPDQSRLYVGNASPLTTRLYALLLPGDPSAPAYPPPVVGEARPDANGWVRGEFFITPDSQFLVNRWGKVYRLTKEER